MSETICQYKLESNSKSELFCTVPLNTKILAAGYIPSKGLFIWAITNSNVQKNKKIYFNIYCTGKLIDKVKGTFLNTVIDTDNSHVYHIFIN